MDTSHTPESDRELDRLSASATYAALLVEMLLEKGVMLDELLSGTQIPLDTLKSLDGRLSARQYRDLIDNAVRLYPDPALGFKFGFQLKLSTHGFLGFAAMSAATLGEALEEDIADQLHAELVAELGREALDLALEAGELLLDGEHVLHVLRPGHELLQAIPQHPGVGEAGREIGVLLGDVGGGDRAVLLPPQRRQRLQHLVQARRGDPGLDLHRVVAGGRVLDQPPGAGDDALGLGARLLGRGHHQLEVGRAGDHARVGCVRRAGDRLRHAPLAGLHGDHGPARTGATGKGEEQGRQGHDAKGGLQGPE